MENETTEKMNIQQPVPAEGAEINEDDLFYFVPYNPEQAEAIGDESYSYWRSVFKNFFKKKVAVVMLGVFLAIFMFTFIALYISKYDPLHLKTNSDLSFTRPNQEYWFGTDNIGRDYWSQVWYATRISIELAGIVALGECLIGITIGLIWGYVRKADGFFTELYNIIYNVPRIIYLTLIALVVGRSFWIMAFSLMFFGWLPMARNVRNLVFMYRDREYNLASRCLGTPIYRILLKNILPYLVSVIILRLALSIPGTIATESTLSYLGLGLDVNTPSLGILLRNARTYFLDFPYLLVFPAINVSIITVAFYLAGNAFSDAADPKTHR